MIDALGDAVHVFTLFVRVLLKLFFDRFAGNPRRCYGVHRVAKYTDYFGGQDRLQNGDRLLRIAPIGKSHIALANVFAGATSQGFYIADEWFTFNGTFRHVFFLSRFCSRATLLK